MKKYTFEVHKYAPELNKIFLHGINITDRFPYNKVDKSQLTNEYAHNIKLVRNAINYRTFNHYINCAWHQVSTGFHRHIGGGFDLWDAKVMSLIRRERSWFTMEKPVEVIKFHRL